MGNPSSISVIIPALNEENNLEALVNKVLGAVRNNFSDYEIIIFNDGSADRTGMIADSLAMQNKKITVVHHSRSKCIGNIYKESRKIATMEYLILVNGKNDISADTLNGIFALRGKYDIIIPYLLNSGERVFVRRFLSKCFARLLNTIFGLKIKYYNHSVLHKRSILNSINIWTNSYAYQAEILIKLIKSGHSYFQLGVKGVFKDTNTTKAFRIKNVLEISLFFIRLIYDIYIKKNPGSCSYEESTI